MEFNRRKNVEQDQRLSTLGAQVNTILTQTPSGFLPKVYYGLTRGADTYRFNQDVTYNIPGLGGAVGDAYELYNSGDTDYIPAIAVQSDTEDITIVIQGDYNINTNNFDLVNMVSGASLAVTISGALSAQPASYLGQYNAQDNQGKQITALHNIETGEDNVVFGSVDFNNDGTFNWIRLGGYTNGTNGTAIWSVNSSNISTVLGAAKTGDSLVSTEAFTEGGITFAVGDIWEITTVSPLAGTFIGNIRGAQGSPGSQGAQGNPGANGETPVIISGNWWIGGVDTGVQAVGQNGTNGVNGQSFIMNSGLYSTDDNYGQANNLGPNGETLLQLPTLPQVSGMTGYAYLVYDPLTTPLEPFYDLYYCNDNDNDWTIMHPFSGIKGANGANGYTPYIYNNTWYINGVSTGIAATGPQGPQGPAGVNQTGNWVVNNSYAVDDLVQYAGSTYVCIQAHSGVSVTPDVDTVDWLLFASKGDQGPTGQAAGFGAPTASVDSNIGVPAVTITASGPNTAKIFNFAFSNLKGDKGDKGDTGNTGPIGPQGLGGAGSNPNLLINGDFRINQRGLSPYTTIANYTVDRWYMATAGTTVTPITNGVTLYGTSNNNYNLYQRIEDYTALQNKKVTFSITFANNTDRFRLRINDTNGNDTSNYITTSSGTVSVTRSVGTGLSQLRCIIMLETTGASMSMDILNAKLEVGEVATPFSPRPYAEELALCQRYYVKFAQALLGYSGFTNNAGTALYATVSCPTSLRTNPTVTVSSLGYIRINSTIQTPTSITAGDKTNNNISLICNVTSIPAQSVATLMQAGFELDAEIY